MIFVAKNEDGTPTWQLVKDKKKTVTSRVNPMAVDKIFAVQPGRGKKALCRAKVVSCIKRLDHYNMALRQTDFDSFIWQQKEAELEGFLSWDGLMQYFHEHKVNFMDLYRIEFTIRRER